MRLINTKELCEIAGGCPAPVNIKTIGNILILKIDCDSQFTLDGYTFTPDASEMVQGGTYSGYQTVFAIENYETIFVLTPVTS